MDALRVEKGHVVVGAEVDGRVTPADLGLGGMVRKAGGFIGWQGLTRPVLAEPSGRRQLVGLEALDGPIPEGAMLVAAPGQEPQGHVTTAAPRVADSGWIGLALVTDGAASHGQELLAWSPTRHQQARVRLTAPLFYDPEGALYRD